DRWGRGAHRAAGSFRGPSDSARIAALTDGARPAFADACGRPYAFLFGRAARISGHSHPRWPTSRTPGTRVAAHRMGAGGIESTARGPFARSPPVSSGIWTRHLAAGVAP